MMDIGIVAAILAPLGTAGAFVWRKVEGRFKELDRKLEKCEQRDRASQSRSALHVAVIELLWREVDRLDPTSKTLKRCKHLIDDLKKTGETTP